MRKLWHRAVKSFAYGHTVCVIELGFKLRKSGVRAYALSPRATAPWKEFPAWETAYDLLFMKKSSYQTVMLYNPIFVGTKINSHELKKFSKDMCQKK